MEHMTLHYVVSSNTLVNIGGVHLSTKKACYQKIVHHLGK